MLCTHLLGYKASNSSYDFLHHDAVENCFEQLCQSFVHRRGAAGLVLPHCCFARTLYLVLQVAPVFLPRGIPPVLLVHMIQKKNLPSDSMINNIWYEKTSVRPVHISRSAHILCIAVHRHENLSLSPPPPTARRRRRRRRSYLHLHYTSSTLRPTPPLPCAA